MNTTNEVLKAANEGKNQLGLKLEKVLTDCEDAPLALTLPSIEFVRTWPDEMMERLVQFAGRHVLQHDFSRVNRAAFATLTEKDPAKRKDMVEEATLASFCKPKEMSKQAMKELRELAAKADAMLKALQDGGDAVWPAFEKGAATYGLKDFPTTWREVTRDHCIRYQAAKAAAAASTLA